MTDVSQTTHSDGSEQTESTVEIRINDLDTLLASATHVKHATDLVITPVDLHRRHLKNRLTAAGHPLDAFDFVDGAETYTLETVDHGQVLSYTGSDPLATARNGVTRVGTHSRFGFGEVRVRPASADRVPDREEAVTGGRA